MWDYRGHKRPPFALEPEPGQESVWDYPRPPKVIACDRLVEVMYGALLIARAKQTYRVLETASPPTFYIAQQHIDWSRLVPIPRESFCEWKGAASYYALADETGATPVAWQYNDPLPGFEMIRGHVCFYPGRVACYVDGEPVRAQHGEFYGGWVTNEIVGPFKGDPGTGHW